MALWKAIIHRYSRKESQNPHLLHVVIGACLKSEKAVLAASGLEGLSSINFILGFTCILITSWFQWDQKPTTTPKSLFGLGEQLSYITIYYVLFWMYVLKCSITPKVRLSQNELFEILGRFLWCQILWQFSEFFYERAHEEKASCKKN
jgi:hypothetical protein